MGYSRTEKCVLRVQSYLDQMVNSSTELEWFSPKPEILAYQLWDAIQYAIRFGGEKYKNYALLSNKYKIRQNHKDSTVVAELRPINTISTNIVVRDCNSALDLIGPALEHKCDVIALDSYLEYDELTILKSFCKNTGYKLEVEDNRIMMRKNEP